MIEVELASSERKPRKLKDLYENERFPIAFVASDELDSQGHLYESAMDHVYLVVYDRDKDPDQLLEGGYLRVMALSTGEIEEHHGDMDVFQVSLHIKMELKP